MKYIQQSFSPHQFQDGEVTQSRYNASSNCVPNMLDRIYARKACWLFYTVYSFSFKHVLYKTSYPRAGVIHKKENHQCLQIKLRFMVVKTMLEIVFTMVIWFSYIKLFSNLKYHFDILRKVIFNFKRMKFVCMHIFIK